ncbi:MAG: sigma factor [Thermaerobacter sp.]|nr:sigma factor [Thermaerobacter sp.]
MAGYDLTAWYQTESPAVRHYLLGLIGDPQLAEDLTQETFIQAMLAVRGYRGGRARAYLFGRRFACWGRRHDEFQGYVT